MITPTAGLAAGKVVTVVVGYAGTPTVVTDPDKSIEGGLALPAGEANVPVRP